MAVSPLRTAAVVVCVASIRGPDDEVDAAAAAAANTSGAAAACCCKMEMKKTKSLNIHPVQRMSDTVTPSEPIDTTDKLGYFDTFGSDLSVYLVFILSFCSNSNIVWV